jgi:hypothetical protein
MRSERTHREVRTPKISARYLADFMAGSETAKRSIVRGCKYQSVARVVQHDEAKKAIGEFMVGPNADLSNLIGAAERLRSRIADSDFERDLYDHNAEYISRFAQVSSTLSMPEAGILPPGLCPPIPLSCPFSRA